MTTPPSRTTAAPQPAPEPAGPGPVFAPAEANRANNFNLVRFLLATLVILSHSPELIDGDRHREILTRAFGTLSFGELAVDGFFLLSGFLIVQSWQRRPVLGDFLTKRALRIYPGFIVAAFACTLIVGPLGSPDPGGFLASIHPVKYVASVLALQMPALALAFPGWPYRSVNGALWTIAYEARSYLLVALLGWSGLAGRRWAWPAIAGVALFLAVSPVPIGRLAFRGSYWLYGEPETLMRLVAFFAAGACFYEFRARIGYRAGRAAVAAALLAPCLLRPGTAQVGVATLGAYVLFWFVFAPLPYLAKFRERPDISYGIYLYGWPMQKLLIYYIPGISPWLVFVLAFLLAGGAGWLSWTFVEAPCLRWKRRATRDPGIPVATAAPVAAQRPLSGPA